MIAEFLDYKANEGSLFRRKIAQSPRNKMNVYGMTADLPGYFRFPEAITGIFFTSTTFNHVLGWIMFSILNLVYLEVCTLKLNDMDWSQLP